MSVMGSGVVQPVTYPCVQTIVQDTALVVTPHQASTSVVVSKGSMVSDTLNNHK